MRKKLKDLQEKENQNDEDKNIEQDHNCMIGMNEKVVIAIKDFVEEFETTMKPTNLRMHEGEVLTLKEQSTRLVNAISALLEHSGQATEGVFDPKIVDVLHD